MNGRERKNKWQRAKSPEPMILQPRDQEIITRVYEFGFLSRNQIQRLMNFNCTIRANIRLRKLFDHGYLARRFLPAVLGSSMAIYFLGPEGADLVSEKIGIDPSEIQRRQKSLEQRKDLFFDHDLLVNEVRIAFYQALANPSGLRLDRWLTPIDCLEEYSCGSAESGKEIKTAFRPDGYFRYFHNDKVFGCFVEVDRSTMNNSRFQAKVKMYLGYAMSGLYQRKYGLKFFRVLVVAKNKERLLNLKASVERFTEKIFWFTTWQNLQPGKVFGPIWQRPGKEGNFTLLEP
jgi:hypothetical protein